MNEGMLLMQLLSPPVARALIPACPPIPVLTVLVGFMLALTERNVPPAATVAMLLAVGAVTTVLTLTTPTTAHAAAARLRRVSREATA